MVNKVVAYYTKDKTIFGEVRVYSSTIIKANDELVTKELNKTFISDWYVIDGKLEKLVEVNIEEKNIRYELKNKDLYNEKIPMIIDDCSKDIYQELLNADLYKKVYDEIEIEKPIPFDLFEVNVDGNYDLKTAKYYKSGYNYETYLPYLISLVSYNKIDCCLVPRPLLDLTRTCYIYGENLFIILSDMIESKLTKEFRVKSASWCFEILNWQKTNSKLKWYYSRNDDRYNKFNRYEVYGNNYDDLIKRIESFVQYVVGVLNEDNSQELIDVALDELAQGKDFRVK